MVPGAGLGSSKLVGVTLGSVVSVPGTKSIGGAVTDVDLLTVAPLFTTIGCTLGVGFSFESRDIGSSCTSMSSVGADFADVAGRLLSCGMSSLKFIEGAS